MKPVGEARNVSLENGYRDQSLVQRSEEGSHCDSKVNFVHEWVIGGVTFFCLFFTFSGRGSLRDQAPFWCSLGEVIGESWWQSVYMLINTCEQNHRLDLFHLWVNFDIFKV